MCVYLNVWEGMDDDILYCSEMSKDMRTLSLNPQCITELSVDGRCCSFHYGFERQVTALCHEVFADTAVRSLKQWK